MAARPDVAATLDAGDTPADARSLLIRGTATLETVDGVPDEYLEAASKVLDAEQIPLFETNVRAMYEQMVRISIEPTWAKFFDSAPAACRRSYASWRRGDERRADAVGGPVGSALTGGREVVRCRRRTALRLHTLRSPSAALAAARRTSSSLSVGGDLSQCCDDAPVAAHEPSEHVDRGVSNLGARVVTKHAQHVGHDVVDADVTDPAALAGQAVQGDDPHRRDRI